MIDNNIIPEWSAMSTAQKANFIRYAVSALRRGEPIDLTNLAEAWRLFYGDYLLACGGKLHSEGGNLLSGEDTDSLDLKWPNTILPFWRNVVYRIMSLKPKEQRNAKEIALAVFNEVQQSPINYGYTGSWQWDQDKNGDFNVHPNEEHDLNWLFLYGNTKNQFNPITKEEYRGHKYGPFLAKNYPNKNIENYYGNFTPANKAEVVADLAPVVDYLAKRDIGIYSDAIKEGFPDFASKDEVKDAVKNGWTAEDSGAYRVGFGYSPEGKPEIQFSDLIDFGGGYKDKWGTIAGILGNLLNSVGNPVILRQYTPIEYVSNREPNSYGPEAAIIEAARKAKLAWKNGDDEYTQVAPMKEVTVTPLNNLLFPFDASHTNSPTFLEWKQMQKDDISKSNLFDGTKTNSLNLKDLKIGVRDIISYINKYKAADYWTLDDINHLASKLYSTGWDPEAILYVIGTESSYNPNAANPVSSARGLALITNGTASDIFGEKNYKSIMDQYNRKKRTTHDSIDDAFRYYSHIDKLITKNRDNMGYGRLKVNMLAPYATLDTAIKNINGIYDSLTSNQKKYVASLEKKLGRKATFADLMEMYDKEFNNRDHKKELIEYAPPAVDLDTPVNIPSIIMPTDAILLQEVPIMPEATAKISYIPTNPVNNYVEATTEKTSGEELAGLKALNAFREAMSFNHMMLDLNKLLYSELPAWDPLGVINNPLEFFKLKGNGGNLLALGTDDAEDPEEYSGWLLEFNVTPTSSGQYLQGYDENGRKVYTVDPNQRMSNDFTADRLARWDEKFRNSQLPNTGEQWANIATGAIGLPMIATSPVTGALVGDLVSDLIAHPIANAVGFGTGYLGNKVDKSLGITSAVNSISPDKINLPEGTIGEFVGYPLGRFSKEIGTGLANVADWAARKAYAPYDFYRTVSETTLPIKEPYLNVGWAPKQIFNGYHASNDPWFVPDFWKENWAVLEHGAPYGVYIAEGEKPTSGFLTNRPYIYQTETVLEKPFVLVGEVSGIGKNATRNEIERQALLMGADGIIYQGIGDNQMPNLTILKTLNPDTKVNVKYPQLDKLIRKSLFDAEEYKASKGYKQLIEKAREESTDMGFGDFPNSLFSHKTLKSPDIILESRPRRKLAAYRPIPNEISIDPAQLTEKTAETVPFHEGLHWQRVGEPEGPLYRDWAKSFYSNDSKQIQDLKFDKYYDSPEYLGTKNARNYLAHKIESALYGDADEYLKKPGELQVLGLETGKALGIKPFAKYPGDKEALEIIEKAREYSPWWGDIRTYTSKHLKAAWDILTGNFVPSALPFATLFGIDASKEDSGNLLNK